MQMICNDLAKVSATHIPYAPFPDGKANIALIEGELKAILGRIGVCSQ
jgi:hypothetical protein